jgi:hypothetical protein
MEQLDEVGILGDHDGVFSASSGSDLLIARALPAEFAHTDRVDAFGSQPRRQHGREVLVDDAPQAAETRTG